MLWDFSRPRYLSGRPRRILSKRDALFLLPRPSRHTASPGRSPGPWLPWVSTHAWEHPLALTAPSLPSQSHCHGLGCILHVPALASGPSLGSLLLNPTTALHKILSSPHVESPLPTTGSRSAHHTGLFANPLGENWEVSVSLSPGALRKGEVPSSDDDSSEKCQGRAVGSRRRCQARSGGKPRGLWEGTDRRLRPSLPPPTWWSQCCGLQSSLPLPPCAQSTFHRICSPPTSSLFQHTSSDSDISGRAAECAAASKYDTLLVFWAVVIWKQQVQGKGFSESPFCLKTDPPWIVIDSLPGVSSTREDLFSSKRRLEVHVCIRQPCHKLVGISHLFSYGPDLP